MSDVFQFLLGSLYSPKHTSSVTFRTHNPSCPLTVQSSYTRIELDLVSFWLTSAPQLLQPGHRGVRPLVFCRWLSDCYTRSVMFLALPRYAFAISTSACMFAACPITEQRRGSCPGVPFQTRKSESAMVVDCPQVCTKFEFRMCSVTSRCAMSQRRGCGDPRGPCHVHPQKHNQNHFSSHKPRVSSCQSVTNARVMLLLS